MAVIDGAYTYYLTTYGNRTSTRFDTHKKSELRNIYSSIVKLNKETPLYKFKTEGETARFAIDIKEGAQNIRNVVASISGSDDIMEALQKKIATSSDEDIVKARYIGKNDPDEHTEDFDIEVLNLAKPQINIGNFLKSSQCSLAPDTYSFDLNNSSSGYEFQFTVSSEDTNYTIQNKLANLITNAGIGLTASIIEDESGQSALRIESLNTGLAEGENFLFKINASGSTNSATALEILGIDHLSQQAESSSFLLNGNQHSSLSNTFSINNVFELQLDSVSPEGEPVTIGFKPNAQAIRENIQTLADAYNSIIDTSSRYSMTQSTSQKLHYQISSTARYYQEELEAIGLNMTENGQLSVDSSLLTEVIDSDNPSEKLSVLNNFKRSLDAKASVAMLNPMDYVNKVIVSYKNPGKNFAAPYASSLYSGMMLDRFC